MTTRVTVEPLYEPISLEEARTWCRVDSDDTTQDAALRILIKAARRYAENRTGRAFIQRTYELRLSRWPAASVDGYVSTGFKLPFPPLRSVSSVKYLDLDGTLQTLAADQYVVHTEREPGLILPAWQVTWPSNRVVPDGIRVVFVAGYAESGSPSEEATAQAGLPEDLTAWMRARIATLYEQREQIITGTIVNAVPENFADGMLDDLVTADRVAG